MKKSINILLATLLLFQLSCGKDREEGIDPSTGTGQELTIYFSTKVPSMRSNTRAVQEDALTSMTVLVFEDTGSGYFYTRQAQGFNLGPTAGSQYTFTARVPQTTTAVKLYLLGNYTNVDDKIAIGDDETTVRLALVEPFTAAGFDGTLPMFGQIEFPDGLSADIDADAELVRSVARVDVLVNGNANFTLSTVQIFRASDQYQIIPDVLVNNVATTASIPSGTSQTVNTTAIAVTGNQSVEQLYLPESPLPAEADRRNATVVVVGGQYGGSTQTTYYRIDFVPNSNPDLFGQVLRNHRYGITITQAEGSGWLTPDEAANNQSTQITAEIKVWDENTVDMVFDNVYYFGVSSRTISLSYLVNSQRSIRVDTNVGNYSLYWADENGTIDTFVNPIEAGGEFTSRDGLYTVSIATDGTSILATANEAGAHGRRYLLAAAGRLRLLLSVEQVGFQLAQRDLLVYGRQAEIGRLGDSIFSAGAAPDRPYGMVDIMYNKSNFGPSGVVSIQGIKIGGQDVAAPLLNTLNLFDVVYLTYAYNPDATVSQRYLNWLNASSRRVLIVQYDNNDMYQSLLTTLGFPASTRASGDQVAPFTIYTSPPQEIMQGPFGVVASTMTFRSYDGTHGSLDLQTALNNNVSPILVNSNNRMVLGVDLDKRIVYSGDIDLYNYAVNSGRSGQQIVNRKPARVGVVENDAEKLIANLWAWIASVTLTEAAN